MVVLSTAVADNFGAILNFCLLDDSLCYIMEKMYINTQPYDLLCGTAGLAWQDSAYIISLKDDVKAALVDNTCKLLCILDVFQTANSDCFKLFHN